MQGKKKVCVALGQWHLGSAESNQSETINKIKRVGGKVLSKEEGLREGGRGGVRVS